MSQGKRKNRRHSVGFKRSIVYQRLTGTTSLTQLCRIYSLSPENVIKWTRRFLAGEPLEKPRGRPKKPFTPEQTALSTEEKLQAENERLRMELAYKNELIKLLEKHACIKKKNASKSLSD